MELVFLFRQSCASAGRAAVGQLAMQKLELDRVHVLTTFPSGPETEGGEAAAAMGCNYDSRVLLRKCLDTTMPPVGRDLLAKP